MGKVVSIIGIDISKRYFQLPGATAGGEPVLRKKLTRSKLLGFLVGQPLCPGPARRPRRGRQASLRSVEVLWLLSPRCWCRGA